MALLKRAPKIQFSYFARQLSLLRSLIQQGESWAEKVDQLTAKAQGAEGSNVEAQVKLVLMRLAQVRRKRLMER